MARALVSGLIILSLAVVLLYAVNRRTAGHDLPSVASGSLAGPAGKGLWKGPDSSQIPKTAEGELIGYGWDLIVHTAHYFGPDGIISCGGNGMNCQNCHLSAGTKPWGNNYGGVFSTYPKYRDRRGSTETIPQRINDCFSRSLNGWPLDSNSHEMKAILAYIQWLGKDVPKGAKPAGSGIQDLKFLDRPADSATGRRVYVAKCQRCHGPNGQGDYLPNTVIYKYPPLWGLHSYNTGAGLYRLSRFAGFVKNNMPFGTDYTLPELTDEEAWDVAAFVNSRPRPAKAYREDWPDIGKKPYDHPFGPYADSFPEKQHKYGPFAPILKATKEVAMKK
jgi:thiosulfate dehydrogenase